MTPLTYKLIAHDGRILGEFDNRYDADKALFATNERASLHEWVLEWSHGRSKGIVNDNHDVFPLEGGSAWIPVGERLPEMPEGREKSAHVLVTNGRWMLIARFWADAPHDKTTAGWFEGINKTPLVGITHWQPLPSLP